MQAHAVQLYSVSNVGQSHNEEGGRRSISHHLSALFRNADLGVET